jgi:hypothetical protein
MIFAMILALREAPYIFLRLLPLILAFSGLRLWKRFYMRKVKVLQCFH